MDLQARQIKAAWALLALALLVTAWGLGGQYIPRNGDEMVYAHIARLTARSGQWLPLVSELDHMRNTKPPLLFWQAMAATQWGHNWTLLALRLPSLVYLALTAALCGVAASAAARAQGASVRSARASGALAGAIFLAFLSSFRYGRPYLTSAPETFWLALPMVWLLWRSTQARRMELGWALAVLLGLCVGLGAAYKSFALIVPACGAFWLALVWLYGPARWGSVVLGTVKVALMALVALAVFGLWFALDPDPMAVWREFVVGENAGKLGQGGSYWSAALSGGSSIWVQALAYLVNAGVLAFLLLGLGFLALFPGVPASLGVSLLSKHERRISPTTKVLIAWAAVWLVVFCIPSTRSARYVIPAMPALAVLLALHWQRLARGWFVATLLLALLALAALARLAWVMDAQGIASGSDSLAAAGVFAAGAGCALWALARPEALRGAALAACLLVYAAFSATVAGLDGPAGRFTGPEAAALKGAVVRVPSGFNGQFERYEFLLPGNTLAPYPAVDLPSDAAGELASAERSLAQLLARGDALVWAQPARGAVRPCARGECRVLAQRWDTAGRQAGAHVTAASLWQPQDWLLRREWLLQPTQAAPTEVLK